MTKREQYGLVFSKVKIPFYGDIRNICKKVGPPDEYSHLQDLNSLNSYEVGFFIEELTKAINGEYYEEYFCTDGAEHLNICLRHPNVIFGENNLIIPMEDLKLYLQEWLDFMTE